MTATDTSKDELIRALLDDPDFMDRFKLAMRARPERPFFNMAGDQINLLAGTPTGRVQVSPGQTISSASWGNPVWDQSVNCFASATDRDAQWPTPHDGAMCYTADTGTAWLRKAGAWAPIGGTGLVPLGAGAPFQSVIDASGVVWVAKGGVNGGAWKRATDVLHARWWRSAAFTLSGTGNNYAYDNMNKDDYGLYSGTAFVAPITGWWEFVAQTTAAAGAAGQWINSRIFVNGATNISTGIAQSGAGAGYAALARAIWFVGAGSTFAPQGVASVSTPGTPGLTFTFGEFSYRGSA